MLEEDGLSPVLLLLLQKGKRSSGLTLTTKPRHRLQRDVAKHTSLANSELDYKNIPSVICTVTPSAPSMALFLPRSEEQHSKALSRNFSKKLVSPPKASTDFNHHVVF